MRYCDYFKMPKRSLFYMVADNESDEYCIPELKGRDTILSGADMVANPTVATGSSILLNGIAQGSDYNERTGRRIHLHSIYLRFIIFAQASRVNDVYRIVIVQDKQSNGSNVAGTDVVRDLDNTTTNALVMGNLNNRERFHVLMDEMGVLNQYTDTGPLAIDLVQRYKKLDIDTVYNNVGATATAITTGAIWLLLFSTQNQGTDNLRLSGTVRLRFNDC